MWAISPHLLNYFLPIPPGIHFLAQQLSNVWLQEGARPGWRRGARGLLQSTPGMLWLCRALHGVPWQPSTGMDVALIRPELDAAPHRGLATAFGSLHGYSQNQSAPKGRSMDTAQHVFPVTHLLSGPGKWEKLRAILFKFWL